MPDSELEHFKTCALSPLIKSSFTSGVMLTSRFPAKKNKQEKFMDKFKRLIDHFSIKKKKIKINTFTYMIAFLIKIY